MKNSMPSRLLLICLYLSISLNSVFALEKRKNHSQFFTLDSHVDTPLMLSLPGFKINNSYNPLEFESKIDFKRLKRGGLDSAFWVIYSPQGPLDETSYRISLKNAKRRVAQVMKMVSESPDKFVFVKNAEQLESAKNGTKHVVLMSMENAYPLGSEIDNLDYFYEMGVRMLGIVHFSNNQFADSSTDSEGERWGGLSSKGIALVEKANSLGMIIDASHASDKATEQMIALSKTPIILSHSGVKAIFDHPRNIDDTLLKKLVDSGGVIQMNAYPSYLRETNYPSMRGSALKAHYNQLYKNEDNEEPMLFEFFSEKVLEIKNQFPAVEEPTFEDFSRHLAHALKVAGPSHVGIGADWDGGGGVVGMEDVSFIPKITQELIRMGLSDVEIQSVWSENVIRLMKAAESLRRKSVR